MAAPAVSAKAVSTAVDLDTEPAYVDVPSIPLTIPGTDELSNAVTQAGTPVAVGEAEDKLCKMKQRWKGHSLGTVECTIGCINECG